MQYADFALWQRRWLAGETLAAELAWWRAALAGAPALDLMADHPRPAVMTQRGADHPFALGGELSRGIAALARREGVTPFMVLAAALFALLSRLTGQRDLTLGSPIANRNQLETEGLIGFFVNTLVLRADLARARASATCCARCASASLGAYAHQDLPFEKLVDELQPVRDLSRSPLFQVALALQNAPLPAADLGGVRLQGEEIPSGIAKFDLILRLQRGGGRPARRRPPVRHRPLRAGDRGALRPPAHRPAGGAGRRSGAAGSTRLPCWRRRSGTRSSRNGTTPGARVAGRPDPAPALRGLGGPPARSPRRLLRRTARSPTASSRRGPTGWRTTCGASASGARSRWGSGWGAPSTC